MSSTLPNLRGFLITGLPLHNDYAMFMTNRQLARLVQEVVSNHLQMKSEDIYTALNHATGFYASVQYSDNHRD
jgi:hypothetical protein